MTLAEHKKNLIDAYQQSWKISADNIEKAIAEIKWDDITSPSSADAARQALHESDNRSQINLMQKAKDPLKVIGVDSYSGDLDFIIETPEFKAFSKQSNFLKDAENMIREKGVNAFIATGKEELKSLPKNATIEDFAEAAYKSIGVEFKNIGHAHVAKMVKNINEKNVAELSPYLSDKDNTVSTAIFERLTGVKLPKTSRDTLIKLDEWAGINPTQRAAIAHEKETAKAAANAEKELQKSWESLKNLMVKSGAGIINGCEFIKKDFNEGYIDITKEKVGAAVRYAIHKEGVGTRSVNDRTYTNFLKAAITYGGLEAALTFLDPDLAKKETKAFKIK